MQYEQCHSKKIDLEYLQDYSRKIVQIGNIAIKVKKLKQDLSRPTLNI